MDDKKESSKGGLDPLRIEREILWLKVTVWLLIFALAVLGWRCLQFSQFESWVISYFQNLNQSMASYNDFLEDIYTALSGIVESLEKSPNVAESVH